MVGEAERASYAAQEKMRKQMETIVAETEARMTETMELQLHAVMNFAVLTLGSFSLAPHFDSKECTCATYLCRVSSYI